MEDGRRAISPSLQGEGPKYGVSAEESIAQMDKWVRARRKLNDPSKFGLVACGKRASPGRVATVPMAERSAKKLEGICEQNTMLMEETVGRFTVA